MTEKLTQGKLRAGIFGGVFGLVCILITMFVGYTFTFELPTTMEIVTVIIAVLTMWMAYSATYIGLTLLAQKNG